MRHKRCYMMGAIFACSVLIQGCATLGSAIEKEVVVEVIAHRGASAYAPENTLAAFRLAHDMGAPWYELDCMLSADGEVVVIHDHDTERTTGKAGRVDSQTLAELRSLDAGSWKDPRFAGEPIPTLGESLDLAKGKIGVYVEIKNSHDDSELIAHILDMAADVRVMDDEFAKAMMTAIEASGTRNLELTRKSIALIRERRMENEVVIQSFSPIVCAVAAVEAPEMTIEILGYDDKDDRQVWERYLRWCYLLGLDGFNTNRDSLTLGRLVALQKSGKSVAIWTINNEDDMRRYIRWGVNRIITDRPDLCISVVEELGRSPVASRRR